MKWAGHASHSTSSSMCIIMFGRWVNFLNLTYKVFILLILQALVQVPTVSKKSMAAFFRKDIEADLIVDSTWHWYHLFPFLIVNVLIWCKFWFDVLFCFFNLSSIIIYCMCEFCWFSCSFPLLQKYFLLLATYSSIFIDLNI